MTTRIAWMRGRTGVSRYAERAALFRTAQNAADQNSAGRYPLISSPMQISTRVGVLQAIGRPFSAFLNEHVKSARAGAQSGISLQFTSAVRREQSRYHAALLCQRRRAVGHAVTDDTVGPCRPESLLRRRLPGVAEGDRQ